MDHVAPGRGDAARLPTAAARGQLVDRVPPQDGRDRRDLFQAGAAVELGRPANVLRLVVSESMAPVALGAACGVLGACAATRGLQSMLYGVTPLDPVSLVAAPALLALVAVVACVVPARRATRVDPVVALREE